MPGLVVALQGVVFGVIGGTILGLGIGSTLLLSVVLAALSVSFATSWRIMRSRRGSATGDVGSRVLLLGATVAVAVSSVGTG